jgi:hypothetical protein
MMSEANPTNADPLVTAQEDLLKTIPIDLLEAVAVDARQRKADGVAKIMVACIYVTAWRHITYGFPLSLPVEVLTEWIRAQLAEEQTGKSIDVVECGDCGYRVPDAFRFCPLCFGVTGQDLYFKRRRARADRN